MGNYLMGRCTGIVKSTGKRCRWPADHLVGGIMVCQYHDRWAAQLWNEVKDDLPDTLREAAERDTRERNRDTTY